MPRQERTYTPPPLRFEDIKDDLISVVPPSRTGSSPRFFTGYDYDCGYPGNQDPTNDEGIKIALYMLDQWQQVLNYYQRKE